MTDAPDELPGPGGRAFTAEQRPAVDRRAGSMLLSANAGSGKTTVLAERFVRAVLLDGIAPSRLLAITFTDKAAGELRSRLRERLIELDRREATREMETAWVSTIHGFCARILRSHPVAAGIDPGFTVLDEATSRALRTRAWEDALADLLGADAADDALRIVAAYGPDQLHAAVAEVHDELRSHGHTSPRLPTPTPREDAAAAVAALRNAAEAVRIELAAVPKPGTTVLSSLDMLAGAGPLLDAGDLKALGALKLLSRGAALQTDACAAFRDAVVAVEAARVDAVALPVWETLAALVAHYGERYAAAKRARSALDYDDLELHVRELFAAEPALADGYAERFERVMVDEFQDTNPLQIAIVDRLDRGNVFCVGDALQSIYGFRHADVEVFRARRDAHARRGEAATLATNWRSRPELLHTVNALFHTAHPDYSPLVAGRQDPPDPDGPRTELLLVDTAFNDDALVDPILAERIAAGMPSAKRAQLVQARAVARRVRELVDAGTAPGDVALLLRAASELQVYERALELEGLPTLASGGRGFWGRQQVQDLTAYLGALVNPRDGLALLSVLASPLVGVSSDALALLAAEARRRDSTTWDVLAEAWCAQAPGRPMAVGPADAERLAAFCARFAAERERASRLALDDLIARVVDETGYDLHVLRLPGGRRRLANVHKLQRLAAAFEAEHGRDVRGFIDHARAELEADAREPDAPIDPGDRSAVALMTIHAAKGLEFDVVVVADLGRKRGAQPGLVLVDGARTGLRLVETDLTRSAAFALDDLVAERRAREDAEERRILHVAVTRAKERLILAGATALGEEAAWPTASVNHPPLALLGPLLDPELPQHLADTDELLYDETRGGHALRLLVRRVGLDDAGPRLGLDLAPGQLELTLDGGIAPRAADAEAGIAAPLTQPPRTDVPSSISYTQLAGHARCGYRHYLERVLRLPREEEDHTAAPAAEDDTAERLEALARGKLLHEVMETVDVHDPQPPGDEELDRLATAEDLVLTPADRDDLRALVAAFAGSALRARMAAATDLHREEPFVFGLGPTLVAGVVDVRAREPDGTALVVDYKTDRLAPGEDVEALVARDYGAQRAIYALAELHAGAPAVEVVHLFLDRPDAPAIARHTQADVAALEADLLERARPLLAGEFPVTDRPDEQTCQGCPGRGTLCSWPREATERPRAAAV